MIKADEEGYLCMEEDPRNDFSIMNDEFKRIYSDAVEDAYAKGVKEGKEFKNKDCERPNGEAGQRGSTES